MDDEAWGEIDTAHPGYLSSQDTFYVGTLKGVGRVYQQTGLSDSLCLGRFSDINETLTEDDGELCLGLGPFTRRALGTTPDGRMI